MLPPSQDSPLLCTPAEKSDLEIRNQATAIAFIAEFFQRATGRSPYVQSVLLELHALTIKDIYPCAGEFRNATSQVTIAGANITPVDPYLLPGALADLLSKASKWRSDCKTLTEKLAFAASCFHRFMAIHPFMGGNGRVGRAFLLMMLHDMGIYCPYDMLLTYIQTRRIAYIEALREADNDNFAPLGRFIEIGIAESRRLEIASGALQPSLAPLILKRLNARERQLLQRPAWTLHMPLARYEREQLKLLKRLEKIADSLLAQAGTPTRPPR